MTTPVPSGSWDVVTLRWLARPFAGSVGAGHLQLKIDQRRPLLYDDPAAPVTVFTSTIEVPLTVLTLGSPAREYLYVEVDVPASDDPDIAGAGFAYTATIRLDSGPVYGPFTFTVPAAAPGGEWWISTAIAVEPAPCELPPHITLAAFDALTARVAALENG